MKHFPRQLLVLSVACSLLAVGSAGTSLAASSSASSAKVCHGERATLVGDGTELKGTSHRDVIVTNGSRSVYPRGGDDLVCVTGEASVELHDGEDSGDDVFDASKNGNNVVVYLAGGHDVVTGSDSSAGDAVYLLGSGSSRIDVGKGPDQVDVDSRRSGGGTDEIKLGPGADTVAFDGRYPRRGHVVRLRRGSGGPAGDRMIVSGRPGIVDADNGARTLSLNGVPRATWDAPFDAIDVFTGRKHTNVRLRGSDRAETLSISNRGSHTDRVALDARGGDDVVLVDRVDGGRIDGGHGDDVLQIDTDNNADVAVDQEQRQATIRSQSVGINGAFGVRSFASVAVETYGRIDLTGNDEDNTLAARTCEPISVVAGKGDDVVRLGVALDCPDDGPAAGGNVQGGPGDDHLVGGQGDDILGGNKGDDAADGGNGTDTCYTEHTERCELP